MTKTCEVEVWVAVDEEGVASVADCREDVSLDDLTGSVRFVRVVLTVPLPTVSTLTGVVPVEGDATLAVA